MVAQSTAAVAWQLECPSLVITWDRGDEPVEWIADGLDRFVKGLTELLGIDGWRDAYRNPWPADKEGQRRFVGSSPVTIEDVARPEFGYSVWLYGPDDPNPIINIRAGETRVPEDHTPQHGGGISFDPAYGATPPRETIDEMVALAVRAWQPLLVYWSTPAVVQASRRRHWDVRAGYRVWINTDTGAVTEVAEGISVRPLEGGTLITAPDEWDAATVAHAVDATLDANGLHDIRQLPEPPATTS